MERGEYNIFSDTQDFYPQDIEILGWCPAGTVLPHEEKVPI